jgi:signal transduction histidine kinase
MRIAGADRGRGSRPDRSLREDGAVLSAGASTATRIAMMSIIIVATVALADGLGNRIGAAALLVVGELALIAARRVPRAWGALAIGAAIVCGLAATITAPDGLAEVMVLSAGARIPEMVSGSAKAAAVWTASAALGATVWGISGSLVGLLAGLGVYLLAERTEEQVELRRERDRALALAAELQAAQESVQRVAAAEERERIARDMHDVLAHSLAGLSLQLQATRLIAAREGANQAVLDPLDRAAQLARDGIDEARAVVGALREPSRLGVAEVPGLIERFPGQATLAVEGDPGAVSADAGHVVYRAVQEGLTNAARYAPGSAVDVRLSWSPGRLAVRIADSGRAPDRAPTGVVGGGGGLSGMAERAAAVGGTLRSGPAARGWLIELSVPSADVPSTTSAAQA